MENRQLQTTKSQVPAFVQEKLQTLEGALEYARVLCASKILPSHFYGKKKAVDGKPEIDYDTPKPETLVVVLQYGQEIGMTHMQSIQQLVPVNNLVSIKGDGAKALIMASGKVDSWKEEEIGERGKDSWGFKISAVRGDTKESGVSVFTVLDAKRANLWITDEMVSKYAGNKYSPWFKYPARMLRYRALGFIARDLFSDVLQGIFIEEEARDIETDNTVFVADSGMTVKMNDKGNKLEESAANAVKNPIAASQKKIEPKEAIYEEAKVSEAPASEEPDLEASIPAPVENNSLPIEAMTAPKIEELCKTDKQQVVDWLNEKLGYNYEELFKRSSKNKTVKLIVGLVIAIRDGMLERWAEKELGIKELAANPAPEAIEEKPQAEEKGEDTPNPPSEPPSTENAPYQIPEPDRDMNGCMELSTHLKSLGITSVITAEYLEANNIEGTASKFIATAPIEEINKLIAAMKA